MGQEDLDFAMEHLRRLSEPNTALLITQNEEGEIIDVRVVDVAEAMFLLSHGKPGKRKDVEPKASESSWWAPST
jgi:hypothetical protein